MSLIQRILMQQCKTIKDIPVDINFGLTIGNFDGIHLGHQELLRSLKKDCAKKGLKFVVLTFNPHPQRILRSEHKHFLLNTAEQRLSMIAEFGIDYFVELEFNRDVSTLTFEQFLEREVFFHPGFKAFFLGHDFSFGSNKEGTHQKVINFLHAKFGNKFDVAVCPAYQWQDEVVSSSLVREKLKSGQIELANQLLNRPFFLEGLVQRGDGRGKQIGFPTANMKINGECVIPSFGVYVTKTLCRGMQYQAITNIGVRPTFKNDFIPLIETHIFDFNQDIYGEIITVQFFAKLRDEKKFNSVNELLNQINQDIAQARQFFSIQK